MQADARDGIWLDTPAGRKKPTCSCGPTTSPANSCCKNYCDEKLPALLDSFRYCLLRYGIPMRVYVDGGKVCISRHLLAILVELHVKHIRHPPYQAYCKGKIEAAIPRLVNALCYRSILHAAATDIKIIDSANIVTDDLFD